MKNDRLSLVGLIGVALLLCLGSILTGCAAATPPSASARYTIRMTEPAQPRVTVEALFSGLPPGDVAFAIPSTWGAYHDLDQQLRWLRVSGVGGKSLEMAISPQHTAADSASFVYWRIAVPDDGSVSLEYSIELAGRDGPAPSFVEGDHALLLTRSLFVFPADWLDLPHELPATIQVSVESPKGWPVYTPWPQSAESTYWPVTLDSLLDAAMALGRYRGYAVCKDDSCVNLLVAPSLSHQDKAQAQDLGQRVLTLFHHFGAAPDGAANIKVLAIVTASPAPTPMPRGEALSSNVIVVRADPTNAPDQIVLREAMNLWNAAALRAAPRWTQMVEETWRTLGWADYLVWRMDLDAGRVAPVTYWDRLRRVEHDLTNHPALETVSLNQAAAVMSDDPLAYALVRDKGYLGALLLDQRLRADTEGRLTLSEALRELWKQHSTYQTGAYISTREILRYLGDMAGADYSSFYTQVTESIGPLDLGSVPQFAGPPMGETRMARSPEGVQLVYQWLDGPADRAAIYLEGGPGTAPYAWMYPAAQSLLPYLDVAYLDQRGCGRSDDPGQGGYTTDAFVNDIEVLREALGVGQVTLIGHSWGGYVALAYAARYPERIAALILVSPIPSFPQTVQAQVTMLSMQIGQHSNWANDIRDLQQGVRSFDDLSRLDRMLISTNAYGSDLSLVQQRLQAAYARYGEAALLPPGLTLENATILPSLVARDGLLERDLYPSLSRGRYPTLILHGERDQAVGRKFLDAFAQQIGGQVRDIPGVGHYAHIENPEAVLGEIITFLQSAP